MSIVLLAVAILILVYGLSRAESRLDEIEKELRRLRR